MNLRRNEAPCPGRNAPSTESEGVGLRIGIKNLDGERAIHDQLVLPDELVEPLVGHHAFAIGVDVGAVALARPDAVDGHAESHRLAVSARGFVRRIVANLLEREIKQAVEIGPGDDGAENVWRIVVVAFAGEPGLSNGSL
jgi:hypothetical protein